MENRVRQLRLNVSSPPGRESSALALADRFTRDVLDRCCDVLEAHLPGRVILIREMNLHCSGTETELADPARIDAHATELAESIESQAAGSTSPHSTDAAVIFADESTWLASYLKSQATGNADAWFHGAWRGDGLPARLRWEGGRDSAASALLRLEDAGELPDVLTRLPPAIVMALVAALRSEERVPSTSVSGGEFADEPDPTRNSMIPISVREEALAAISRSLPLSLSREAAGIALYIKALAGTNNSAIERTQSQSFVSSKPPTNESSPASVNQPALPAPVDASAGKTADPTDPSADIQSGVHTQHGGLYYLLGLALELGIGEILWKVCLPERLVLAHAADAILGPDAAGDPAPLFFGGVSRAEMLEFPPVSSEQQGEVGAELLANIAAAIPRRGLAEFPPIYIDILETPAGRMVAAFASGSFVIYAHPAPDARSAADGIAEFLKRWPVSAPTPQARPVLAALDSIGRLQPAPAPPGRADSLIPPASSAPATALLIQLCGSLCCLFALRAAANDEQTPLFSGIFVRQFFSITGRIVADAERLTIVMPMERIDIRLRRSGLDRDPGWIPWLARTVRIEFEGSGLEE
jgi:hypothetical protein